MEFKGFEKIPRLNREICITEKIDGTNAAIGVTEDYRVYAQSRSRIITPTDDNYGFAGWVERNKEALCNLGPGLHFGEWWGVGINRGYDLTERRFSLFNVKRWREDDLIVNMRKSGVPIYVVPVLYEGLWLCREQFAPHYALTELAHSGSLAAPGYMRPEGIVVYHKAANFLFKATIEKDNEPKTARATQFPV